MWTAAAMTWRALRRRISKREMCQLTHIDEHGKASMVDVSQKPTSHRTAKAFARIELGRSIYKMLESSISKEQGPRTAKGDIFTVAQLAGIQAAKRTADLIPLCHTLPLSHVSVDLSLESGSNSVVITSVARTQASTGVEMEALTAASCAALTVYDMCKAGGHGMVIREIQLVEKSGGKKNLIRGEDSSL